MFLAKMKEKYEAQCPDQDEEGKLIQKHRWRLGAFAYKRLVYELALWPAAERAMNQDGGFWYCGIQYLRDESLKPGDYVIEPHRMCRKAKLKFYKLREG